MLTEPEVGPFVSRDSTKGSCVDPSGQDPNMGESDKCGLYVDDNPPRLVALGRVYEGLTTIHSILLGNDIQLLAARVSTKGSYAASETNALAKKNL